MKYWSSTIAMSLLLLMSGCVSKPSVREDLDLTQFEAAFYNDCDKIKTIYEGHGSSGYSFENHEGGNHTGLAVGLTEMKVWLKRCGVNPGSVSQIME